MSFLRNLQPVAMTGRVLKFVGDRLDSTRGGDTSISHVAMSYWSALDVTGSYLRKQAQRLRPGRILSKLRRRPADMEPAQNVRTASRFPIYAPVSVLSLLAAPVIRKVRNARKPVIHRSQPRVAHAASSSVRILRPVPVIGDLVAGAVGLLPGRILQRN